MLGIHIMGVGTGGIKILTVPRCELLAQMEKETRSKTSCVAVIIFTNLRESQLIRSALLEQDRSFRPDYELCVFQETFQEYRTKFLQQGILLVDDSIVQVFTDVLSARLARADLARPVCTHVERATLTVLVPTHHKGYRDHNPVLLPSLDKRAVIVNKKQWTSCSSYKFEVLFVLSVHPVKEL